MIYLLPTLAFIIGFVLGKYVQYVKDRVVITHNMAIAYQKGVQDGKLKEELMEAGYMTRTGMDV